MEYGICVKIGKDGPMQIGIFSATAHNLTHIGDGGIWLDVFVKKYPPEIDFHEAHKDLERLAKILPNVQQIAAWVTEKYGPYHVHL